MRSHEMLDRGRESFARQAWADAYDCLSAADRIAPLEPHDLELLATAAYLVGRDAESADIWTRAHQELLGRGDLKGAARAVFWLALGLVGERARRGGWLARARRLLEDADQDCVEQGYLLVPDALRSLAAGDAAAAFATFHDAAQIGERFHEPDLTTLSRLGQGQALIRQGAIAQGVGLLDEIMVSVTTGEVSPAVVGLAYCAVIEACEEIFDLRRAQEWTAALNRWCDSQPDLVPYRGHCLVHRAEIMQRHGAWRDAMDEARRASERLSQRPGQPAIGAAFYRQAELHRLRGEFDLAEEAYRQASCWEREPRPGLAQLWFARGQVEAAEAAIRRILEEAQDPRIRAKILAPCVEIMLAANDVASARAAADELSELAADLGAPFLDALSSHVTGAVHLAEGEPRSALVALRKGWAVWQELEIPYEAARSRVLIGLACRELGDEESAVMELDAARRVFEELGSVTDLARMAALSPKAAAKVAGGLTAREVQVLRLVAAGKTNREIAADLSISEKTVARHVSNIFSKLGLSSRAAATAYAYRHGLV